MTRLHVLLEGASDEPAVREILSRRFGLTEGQHFKLYPHQGKGALPDPVLAKPLPQRRELLHQLPAKLRAWHYFGDDQCVIVLVDADDDDCSSLLTSLNDMLAQLPRRAPRVLFRIAIEETESWFIADDAAIASAYPRAKVGRLQKIAPDSVVGAWERLAEALGVDLRDGTVSSKLQWATQIAPHLNLDSPKSPSLAKFITGVERYLANDAA